MQLDDQNRLWLRRAPACVVVGVRFGVVRVRIGDLGSGWVGEACLVTPNFLVSLPDSILANDRHDRSGQEVGSLFSAFASCRLRV